MDKSWVVVIFLAWVIACCSVALPMGRRPFWQQLAAVLACVVASGTIILWLIIVLR